MRELDTLKFNGCRNLDFSDRYKATKNLINDFGITKVVWQRQNGDLCQFCTLRGRINAPTGCLTKQQAQCDEYETAIHDVPLESIDIS